MKKLLLGLLIANTLVANTQVISVELIEHYTVSDIQDLMNEVGLPPALIPILYEVDYYSVEYMTLHPNGDSVLVSGGMTLPSGIACPLPLMCYMHGTVAERSEVPSNNSGEGFLGVIYSTGGYAGILPDYIGLGSSDLLHLYVHAESEAQVGVDMIFAIQELQEELGFNLDDQLFVMGYSQGGHAAMALSRKIEEEYAEEITLTASAPMSGPYDISGAQAEVITADEIYPTPGYLPYVAVSYNEVYGTLYEELSDIFIAPYDSIINVVFDGEHSMSYINSLMPDVPNEMLVPEVLEDFETNPNSPIRFALEANDVFDWTPQNPMKLFYCNGDDQVSFQNSVNTIEQFETNGALAVESVDIGDYDHSECAGFAMLGAYYYFGDFYVPYFLPEVEFDVTASSGQGIEDGAITANVIGGDAGLTLVWDNGDSGNSIVGLGSGIYTLTITNDEGCSHSLDVFVDVITGISDALQTSLTLIPNPTDDLLRIEGLHGFELIMIYNLGGKLVYQNELTSSQISLDVSTWTPGTYLIHLDGQVPKTEQFIIR